MFKFYQITDKSFEEMGVKTLKELWKKVKKDHTGFSVDVKAEFTKAEDADEGEEMNNKFHVIMSTASEDRHGDMVAQEWDLKPFKKNNVLLDSHNYDSIVHILGEVNAVKVKDKKLQGDIVYALMNPKGLLACEMTNGGFIKTVSVGFIPKEFDDKFNPIKSELLELSVVSVPANAEALIEKQKKAKEKAIKKTVKKEKKVIIVEKSLKIKKLNAVKNFADKKEKRNKELIKEALVVIQQLNQRGVDAQTEKRMVNRAIKQLIKVK